jgi:hypothetical protein
MEFRESMKKFWRKDEAPAVAAIGTLTVCVAGIFGFAKIADKEPFRDQVSTKTGEDFYPRRDFTRTGKMVTKLSVEGTEKIYSLCVAKDLVEQSGDDLLERSVKHPACEDNKLEPQDFMLQPGTEETPAGS